MIVYTELETLENDLGFKSSVLYGVSSNLSRHYVLALLRKPDGSFRHLSVPDGVLKSIQRAIYEKLLFHMPVSPYATAYRAGSSTYKNALPHCGKKMLLKLDIHDFFGSILYSAVKEKAFPEKIYSEPLRVLLTNLCYYNDSLPQGAATSPAIANIIMYDFDMKVGTWCKTKNITYTRYCDDMAFSGDFNVPEVYDFVRRALMGEGFYLSYGKTRVLNKDTRQSVTGLIVNEKPSVPRAYRDKLRQELFYMQKYGILDHMQKTDIDLSVPEYLQSVLGKVNYVLSVTPDHEGLLSARQWLIMQLKAQ